MVDYRRRSGLILHISSLPSPHGVGALGKSAYQFVDTMINARQTLWQILPTCPVHPDGCPYTGLSAFAGNPLFIDLEDLVQRKLLVAKDIVPPEGLFSDHTVHYKNAMDFKYPLLRKAFTKFKVTEKFKSFVKENKFWLEDWGLFESLKTKFGDYDWPNWPVEYRDRDPEALAQFKKDHRDEILYHEFVQFIFLEQWFALKKYANDKGVRIIGDIPIFVSLKSADVWARSYEFNLDHEKQPITVAGVPPDAFSATGQHWGMPHYRWDKMQQNDYKWWFERFGISFKMFDTVRVDHFRAFAAYWAIPRWESDPRNGYWVQVPGHDFFYKLKQRFTDADIIVEDLGTITDDVLWLRDSFHMPGMKVLQLSFDPIDHEKDLPHNQPTNCVAYTGTHDNMPIRGWYFNEATDHIRWLAKVYCQGHDHSIHWDLIKTVIFSRADKAIFQLQDILGWGHETRMNVPGKVENNWAFRIRFQDIDPWALDTLRALTYETGREAL